MGVDLDRRKEYVNEVKKILLSLKNSLEEDLEEGMQNKGFGRYQSFSEITQGIFSFAYKKLKGIDIPWYNNRMERLMEK